MIAYHNHSSIGIKTLAAKGKDRLEGWQTQELTSMQDCERFSNKKEDKVTSKTAGCPKQAESEASAAQARAELH